MMIRTICLGFLTMATIANAQPPARGRGWGPDPAMRGFIGPEPGRPGRIVTNAPFAADVVTETTQALPDGNKIHQTITSRLYRDSAGRTRHEQSLNGLSGLAAAASQRQVVMINDPVAGVNYALDPVSRTGTKSTRGQGRGPQGPGGAPARQAMVRPQPGQVNANGRGRGGRGNQNVVSESLGSQMVEGVKANGTRTTMTIPAGQIGNDQAIQIVTESWYSADLQTMVLSKRTDPRAGETVTRMMNISRTEPAQTLFQVPLDFKVTETAGRGGPGRGPALQ